MFGMVGTLRGVSNDALWVEWDGHPHLCAVKRITFRRATRYRGQRYVYVRHQFPVAVHYAATIHSVQGLGMPGPFAIDLEDVYYRTLPTEEDPLSPWRPIPGLMYTGLSRASRIEDVFLYASTLLRAEGCAADPDVLHFYEQLRAC